MTDPFVVRAEIVAAHGIRGEVKVVLRTDFPERLIASRKWRLRAVDGTLSELTVAAVREHHGHLLARFRGIDDRSAAAALRGSEVVTTEEELPALPEGEYYWHQLIGLQVVTREGAVVGTIREILVTGSNDVYVTEGPLIPAIVDVVERVDLAARQMIINPLPGLLDP
ncbi:MAG: 16S rRNA processing protein RimM [Fimbriimonadaceae bacterium]|nr:16S rRNA processing protein RimM [Fimbriimonadaceae bacterium]